MCAGEFRNITTDILSNDIFWGSIDHFDKKKALMVRSWVVMLLCYVFLGQKMLWSQRWQSCLFSFFNRLSYMKGLDKTRESFWCRYLNQFIYVGCDRNLNCILRQRRRDIKSDNFDTIMLGWARKGKGDISISPLSSLSSLPKLVLTTARFPTCRAIEKDENS